MSNKTLYPKAFVCGCERHDKHLGTTSLSNRNSDKTITFQCPHTESSKINDSDIIKWTYSKNYLENFLRMPLSLFEMADRIRDIPSPRKRFFQLVITISGLTPNTVKMILCPTSSGIYPKEHIRKKIASSMKMDVNKLFPADRLQSGSIVDIYIQLSSKRMEYHSFIYLLAEASHTKQKTVKKWLKARRVPASSVQYAIAQVIGVSISQLFPLEEGD